MASSLAELQEWTEVGSRAADAFVSTYYKVFFNFFYFRFIFDIVSLSRKNKSSLIVNDTL
jgi:hypothetical protein